MSKSSAFNFIDKFIDFFDANQTDPLKISSLCYLVLSISTTLFIIYACFFYGNARVLPFMEGLENLLTLRNNQLTLSWHNARDIATNLLLYVPLGIFVCLWLGSRSKLAFFSPWICIGPLLSLSIEVIQSFINRYTSVIDLVSNTLGFVLGFWTIYYLIKKLNMAPELLLGFVASNPRNSSINTLVAARFIYIGLFFLVWLVPFDLVVSIEFIYNELQGTNDKDPGIILNPLHHLDTPLSNSRLLLYSILAYAPVGILSSTINQRVSKSIVFRPLIHCILIATISQIAALFFKSVDSDVTQLLMGLLGGILGISLSLYWNKISLVSHTRNKILYQFHRGVSLIWLFCTINIIVVALSPFNLETEFKTFLSKIFTDGNWIPFKLHFSNRNIPAVIDMLRETGVFIPFGFFGLFSLVSHSPVWSVGRAQILILLSAFALAFTLEFTQLAIVGRYMDITDVILAVAGSFAGLRISIFILKSAYLKRKNRKYFQLTGQFNRRRIDRT